MKQYINYKEIPTIQRNTYNIKKYLQYKEIITI